VSFLYKTGICTYYLEKIKINESQKKVLLWHSERGSYVNEALGWHRKNI